MLNPSKIYRHRAFACLVVLAILGLSVASPAVAQRFAEVGAVLEDGTITLHTWKFQSEILDGLPVREIVSEISNGLAHVALYTAGSCRGALLPLWNHDGPLDDPSPRWPVGPVFVPEHSVPLRFECEDNGCLGFEYHSRDEAHCDKLVGQACTCFVISGGDVFSIYGPDYCTYGLEALADWTLDEFIRPQHIID